MPSPQGRTPHARVKLAVVGGGSTYTPELVDGFARLRDVLPLAELVLVDPAADRLELVGGLARRIFAKQGHPGRISWTADLDAGVDGADAVLLQLRIGGQAARNQDETWPLECGCVGQETTGAGGLAKALRTVPVVLDIAERVRRRNPRAWIVDFTNPVGIVTRALLTHGHKAVGLCNVAIGFQRRFAALLGVSPGEVELEHVGLNHLTWERAVRVAGEDVLPRLLADHGDALAEGLRMPRALLDRLGVVPSSYLRYYYQHDAVVRELRSKPSRAAEVAAIERELLGMYGDPALDEKPELLSRRGGAFYSEAAVALTSALLRHTGDTQVVNALNHGTLPFLPDDAVIEVPATVDSTGATPLPLRPLEPLYAGLVAHVTAYEHLALEAALWGRDGRSPDRAGGRKAVFSALLAHPLIGQTDYADRLTDDLIAHNREHLTWA
ncbi:6-phospho-beta-glucosidase [Streptomyces sp. NPDC015125]|uniref:6-phospho-beta-glucosidase n=1 Tax=Streptomyces sp. NPDC015125 TaxID=3364938 RepID=UPI00370244C9